MWLSICKGRSLSTTGGDKGLATWVASYAVHKARWEIKTTV